MELAITGRREKVRERENNREDDEEEDVGEANREY